MKPAVAQQWRCSRYTRCLLKYNYCYMYTYILVSYICIYYVMCIYIYTHVYIFFFEYVRYICAHKRNIDSINMNKCNYLFIYLYVYSCTRGCVWFHWLCIFPALAWPRLRNDQEAEICPIYTIWLLGYVLRPISSWNPMSEMPCWNMEQPRQPDEPHCCQSCTLRGVFSRPRIEHGDRSGRFFHKNAHALYCSAAPLILLKSLGEGIFCRCESMVLSTSGLRKLRCLATLSQVTSSATTNELRSFHAFKMQLENYDDTIKW